MKLPKEWEIQEGKEKYDYEIVKYDHQIRRIVLITKKNVP